MTDTDRYGDRYGQPARRVLPLVLMALVAFLGGLLAMGFIISRWDGGRAWLGLSDPAPATVAATEPEMAIEGEGLVGPPAALPDEGPPPERLLIDPEITRRVNVLEERLGALDIMSRVAIGNADRAEGLLVAFAARRALDRGVGLGYIEGLLGRRFGESQRPAVATIITAARTPVTLGELQDELQAEGPRLVGGGPGADWWAAFQREMGALVTVRRAGSPSPVPAEGYKRAGRALEAGQVDVALVEVLRLPGRAAAAPWIAKARRYVAARRALDAIETAALLEPRAGAAGR